MSSLQSRVAVIGYGKRGKTHLANYRNIRDAQVVAICDPKHGVSQENGSIVQHFSDYKEMIRATSPEMVSICVPTPLHCEIACYCLEQGLHVLLEKPVSLNVEEARVVEQAAEQCGKTLMIGYHLIFDRRIAKIKKMLDAQELGTVYSFRCRQSHDWGGLQPPKWLLDSGNGGGVIFDNAVHYLHLSEVLFGRVESIFAISNASAFQGDVEDNAIITVQLENRIVGTIESSWSDKSGRHNSIKIWGSKGVLEFIEDNVGARFCCQRRITGQDEWNQMVTEDIYVPAGVEQVAKKDSIDGNPQLGETSVTSMLRNFLYYAKNNQCVQKQDVVRVPFLVSAAYRSILEKKPISTR